MVGIRFSVIAQSQLSWKAIIAIEDRLRWSVFQNESGGPTAIAAGPARSTFRAKAGPYCRTYRVDMVTPDRLAPALETACRDDAGVWRRLEG